MCKDCPATELYKHFPRCHSCHKAEKARLQRRRRGSSGQVTGTFTCEGCGLTGTTRANNRKYHDGCAPSYYSAVQPQLSDADRMRLHYARVGELEEIKATAEGELLDLILEQEKDDRRYQIQYGASLDNGLVVL